MVPSFDIIVFFLFYYIISKNEEKRVNDEENIWHKKDIMSIWTENFVDIFILKNVHLKSTIKKYKDAYDSLRNRMPKRKRDVRMSATNSKRYDWYWHLYKKSHF